MLGVSLSQIKATIFGCSGLRLLPEEKLFFSRSNPLGFILFARNCDNPEQVKQLVEDLRQSVGRTDAPILIDQEGGKVSRLNSTHWRKLPAASLFGQLSEDDPDLGGESVYDNSWLIGDELHDLGINVNCAPCSDLLIFGAHPIIGDRSYAETPELVAHLSLKTIEGLLRAGVIPVIKHLPGHGRALVDSHKELPVISATKDALIHSDFSAFRLICNALNSQNYPSPWGMTAHAIYDDIDADSPATHSSKVIEEIIRHHIGFKGFLISDCLTMKALEGSFASRTRLALEAGCDAALHCSGNLEEMIEVAGAATYLSTVSLKRLGESAIPANFRIEHQKEELLKNVNDSLKVQI